MHCKQVLSGAARYLEVLSGTQDAATRYFQAQPGTIRQFKVLPPVAEAKVWDEVMALMNRCVPAR